MNASETMGYPKLWCHVISPGVFSNGTGYEFNALYTHHNMSHLDAKKAPY